MMSARPLASDTCRIGTLRTSMGSGMGVSGARWLFRIGFCGRWWLGLRYDDGPGVPGDRVDDLDEVRDHGVATAAFHEPAHRVDLRPHRPVGEVTVTGEATQAVDWNATERLGLGRGEAEGGGVGGGGGPRGGGGD